MCDVLQVELFVRAWVRGVGVHDDVRVARRHARFDLRLRAHARADDQLLKLLARVGAQLQVRDQRRRDLTDRVVDLRLSVKF